MTYELAKKLKDLKFPIQGSIFGGRQCEGRNHFFKKGKEVEHYESDETVYFPSLSELLEACEGTVLLGRFKDIWLCNDGKISVGLKFRQGQLNAQRGKTADEAVAKYWLELNKK